MFILYDSFIKNWGDPIETEEDNNGIKYYRKLHQIHNMNMHYFKLRKLFRYSILLSPLFILSIIAMQLFITYDITYSDLGHNNAVEFIINILPAVSILFFIFSTFVLFFYFIIVNRKNVVIGNNSIKLHNVNKVIEILFINITKIDTDYKNNKIIRLNIFGKANCMMLSNYEKKNNIVALLKQYSGANIK